MAKKIKLTILKAPEGFPCIPIILLGDAKINCLYDNEPIKLSKDFDLGSFYFYGDKKAPLQK